jgi:FkbM family methyltransferase
MKRKIIDFIAGRVGLQKYFEIFFTAGLYGMNYGNGGDFEKSGELSAAKYIRSKYNHQEPLTIFDVGANRGFYSIKLAETLNSRSFTIHSFEPSARTYEALLENLASRPNIIPNNFGFGERKETLKLYTNNPLSGLASVYERKLDYIGIDMSAFEEISMRTIDDYCNEKNIDHIHFLKLDIEGHELKCLSGAENMLQQKKIDFIQFEFGGCNIDSRTYFQDFWYLLKDNYNFYRIVKNGLVPIKKYNERLEIFKNINYLVELRS